MTILTSKPLVSVLCPTYNQAPFLRQCLDSIVAQQTNFEYEILVNDDASTDDTANIIREYAAKFKGLIHPIYQKENCFSQGRDIIRDILLPQSRGKYIAICEGDDYWISNTKLQHQADIMESDPECGLVYTYFYKYSEARGERFDFHFHAAEGNVYADILASKCTIWYVTVMMRREWMADAPKLDTFLYFTGDVFWYYWVTYRHKVRLLREYTGVYRVLDTSVSHFVDKRKKIDFFYKSSNTRLYFIDRFPPRRNPVYGFFVAKKSKVNCFKYALSHANYPLAKSIHIPFLPLMSLKKTFYWLLCILSFNERTFMRISERYNRYLDKYHQGQ